VYVPRINAMNPAPFIISAFLMLAPIGTMASVTKELDASQKRELAAGETVVIATDHDGLPWPELTLYKKVDAPPEVIAKLFLDYENAPSYIPGMVAAKVVREEGDGTKDVRYTVKMPVFTQLTYTVRNHYSKHGDSFNVKWELLESPVAKSSDGSLRVEPYEGQSIIRYSNLVHPTFPMAGALKGQALKEARATVEAIAKEAERVASTAS